MAKVVKPTEAGLPEGSGLVRVSQGKKTRGKILAVQHDIFGWMPFKQWALLRLVPEDRILPAIIVGISTFTVARLMVEALGDVLDIVAPPALGGTGSGFPVIDLLLNLFGIAPATEFFGLLPPPDEMKESLGSIVKDHPLPFYIGVMAAGLTLAGLDPGMALRAFAELLNALTPLT